MVVHSLGLEEDGVAGVPPKVGDRIAAVTATGLDLQSAAATALVGTGLALLLPPRLVANGRTQVDLGSVGQGAVLGADQDAEATLLQDVHIVVVRVAHGPAGNVLLGLLVVQRVDVPDVAIAPLVELVELLVRHMRHNGIVDVPFPFPLARRRGRHGHGATCLLLTRTWTRICNLTLRLSELGVLGVIGLLCEKLLRLEGVAISVRD